MAHRKRTVAEEVDRTAQKVRCSVTDDCVFAEANTEENTRRGIGTSIRVTRGAARRSLFDAVLLTTELLEKILPHIPMKDLLLAQRVARKWKVVFSWFKQLQQALFLASIQPTIY